MARASIFAGAAGTAGTEFSFFSLLFFVTSAHFCFFKNARSFFGRSSFLFPQYNVTVGMKALPRLLAQSGFTPRSFGTGHSDSGTAFSPSVRMGGRRLRHSPHRGPNPHVPFDPSLPVFSQLALHSRQTADRSPTIFKYAANFSGGHL